MDTYKKSNTEYKCTDTIFHLGDNDIFCPKCVTMVSEFCSLHGPQLIVPDTEVHSNPQASIPKATYTIPQIFLHLATSIIPGAGLGVFSSRTIPRGVRFGPFRGERTTDVTSMYSWQVYSSKSPCYVIDAADDNISNWMRYINCSRNWHEQNLVAYQYRGQIYYSTIKIIPPYTELLVFYGCEFANLLDIDLRKYNKVAPSTHTEDNMRIYDENGQSNNFIETHSNKDVHGNIYSTKSLNICESSNIEKNFDENISLSGNTFDNNCTMNENSPDTTKKIFICQKCNKGFNKKYSLSRHELVHLNTKLYNCNFCAFTTNFKRNLNDHINIKHIKVNIYQCEFCSNKYYSKRSFQKHMMVHIKNNK